MPDTDSQIAASAPVPAKTLAKFAKDGRPAEEYRLWLSALLSQKGHQSAFVRAVTKDKHPHFMAATKHAAAYAIGLPVQPTVDLTPREPGQLAAGALLEAIPRLLSVLAGGEQVKLLQGIEADARVVE